MPISVTCPNPECGKTLKVKDELAGRRGKCPACQGPIQIPRPQPPAAEPEAVPEMETAAFAEPAEEAAPFIQTDAPPQAAPRAGGGHLFGCPALIIRRKGGFTIRIKRDKTILFELADYAKKKTVYGFVRLRWKFDFIKAILKATKRPVKLEITEGSENGPVALTLLFSQPMLTQWMRQLPRNFRVDVLDSTGNVLFVYRYKGKLFHGDLWVETEDGGRLAEVTWQKGDMSTPPKLILRDSENNKLGDAAYQTMAERAEKVEEAMEKGKKFAVSVEVGGAPKGHVVNVEPDYVGNELTHQLLMVLGIFIEITGIGKTETGGGRGRNRNRSGGTARARGFDRMTTTSAQPRKGSQHRRSQGRRHR